MVGRTEAGWTSRFPGGRSASNERQASTFAALSRSMMATRPAETSELETLLAGTTRTLYHNVFAFRAGRASAVPNASGHGDLSAHYPAPCWASARRAGLRSKGISNARQRSLFLPHGQNGVINVALKELESVREDLDRTEHQPEEYWAAQEARVRLAAEVAGLEDIVADLKARVAHYEKRLKSRPMWERRRAIEAKLQSIPAVDSFPEGGLERLELLQKQFHGLQTSRDALRREIELRRMERRDLMLLADPEETARRIQVIDALRKLVPRMEASPPRLRFLHSSNNVRSRRNARLLKRRCKA